jgi:hypothetical protein
VTDGLSKRLSLVKHIPPEDSSYSTEMQHYMQGDTAFSRPTPRIRCFGTPTAAWPRATAT